MSAPMKRIACVCVLWGGLSGALNGAVAETGALQPVESVDALTLDYGPVLPEPSSAEDGEAAAAAVSPAVSVTSDGPFGNATRVSGAMLASMRGAYDSAAGVRISFGIERAVYIDGALVTSTSLNIADVGRMTSEQAGMLGAAGDAVQVVQSGSGNVATLGMASQFAAATVIQNTLDNQKISIRTTIDAATDGLQLLKGLNLGTALRDALSLPLKSQ